MTISNKYRKSSEWWITELQRKTKKKKAAWNTKEKEGSILTGETEIIERWRNFFKELLEEQVQEAASLGRSLMSSLRRCSIKLH